MADYLYHYTSLETLALILQNKTLAFNSLINVDDLEEAETEDMDDFGKYVYVSCWTDEERESIAMWNLYTPDMHGVRIRLPKYPFKKHHYKRGEFFLENDVDTYLDLEKIYLEDRGMIALNYPELIPVVYTQDETLLHPKIRRGSIEDVERFLALGDLSDISDPIDVSYSFANLGRMKNDVWVFQKEWRYYLFIVPMGMKEANLPELPVQQECIRRLENKNTPAPYSRFFIELDEDALRQMEVVFGPRMTEAEKILAVSLLKSYDLDGHYTESKLRIR